MAEGREEGAMSTTSLFVELVVIGTGASTWAIGLGVLVFGRLTMPSVESAPGGAALVIAALSVTYLLGIVTDRAADALLGKCARQLRAAQFPAHADFQHARAVVYRYSPLRESFEYSRSRLRICRGWAVNAVALMPVGLAVDLVRSPGHWPWLRAAVFGELALAALAGSCFLSWREFVKTESENLKVQLALVGTAGSKV